MSQKKLLFVLAASFLVGVALGYLLHHQPALSVKVSHQENRFIVYTYYEDSHGEEIKHGWACDFTYLPGDVRGKKTLYKNGKQVGYGEWSDSNSLEKRMAQP